MYARIVASNQVYSVILFAFKTYKDDSYVNKNITKIPENRFLLF